MVTLSPLAALALSALFVCVLAGAWAAFVYYPRARRSPRP